MIFNLDLLTLAGSAPAAWLHNLDPVIFWRFRWYGLAYAIGLLLAWLLARQLARAGWTSLPKEQAGDLIVCLAIGVIAGGRLGYVLFYRPDLAWTLQPAPPYWGVLAINQGGMSSHGGMIGVTLAAWWFVKRHRTDLLQTLDLAAFSAPPGLILGRIANFINGELIGRQISDGFPWGVKFPQEIHDWPTEKISLLQEKLPPSSQIDPGWRHWSPSHIIAAMQRGEQSVIELVEPMLTTRHPSQLYAALLEGAAVFLVLLMAWRQPRKPGIIGALFCISYGTARIVNEWFRRPDPHLADAEFAWLGITRGQWLSGLLMLAGFWGLHYARRNQAERIGGWCRKGG